jgi:hypothetical protein
MFQRASTAVRAPASMSALAKPSSSCPPFFTSCRLVEHALSVTNRGANLERTSC